MAPPMSSATIPAATVAWMMTGWIRRFVIIAGSRAVQSASHGASGSMKRGPR